MTGLIRAANATHTQPEAAVRLFQEPLGMEAPDLILAFAGGRHVPALVLAARQVSFGYSGFETGLMAFKGADVTPSVLSTTGLAESAAGADRASIMSGADTEEAETALRTLAPDHPFMDVYSGVESAPFAGHYSLPLDWTGVLTILQYAA
jgi:hypothetical protein